MTPSHRLLPHLGRAACLAGSLMAWSQDVVIHEIHHTPDVKQQPVEFVELHNPGAAAVDVSGWRLADAVEFVFPAGTSIPPNGFLVVAGNPAAVEAKFTVAGVLGPWTGRLSGDGEDLVLEDANGGRRDAVDFRNGFPWPTVGDAPGLSIELVHPSLDNSLGGNWRPSAVDSGPITRTRVVEADSTWRYWKGLTSPSTPATAWREPGFDDTAWPEGGAPLGYDPEVLPPEATTGTRFDDMRNGYVSFLLRRRFEVANAAEVASLEFETLHDDGFRIWINGVAVLNVNLPEGEIPFDQNASSAIENNGYNPRSVDIAPGILRDGVNVIAVQVSNASIGGSSDAFFDTRMTLVRGRTGRGPTPGQPNRSFRTLAPPAIRQVDTLIRQPDAGVPMPVTARVTDPDGVASVVLEYQAVSAGAYIRHDDPAYATQWTQLPMNDAGTGGDLAAGDTTYTAVIPGNVQIHRRLVRYRIRATDTTGAEVVAPYPDDPGRNFAYFCHNGVPAWSGAVRPGAVGSQGTPFSVGREEMNRMPVYHLIARNADVEASTWRDRSHGDQYFWTGTLVVDGRVYDHIRFRPRGGVWRYAMGKNMWKFDFNRGHDFRARDNWGREFDTRWTKLNLGASIQQGDYLHRGEHGMFESVGFRLFQLTGQPAPHTVFVQFRIVDSPTETDQGSQYDGDFWGVYLAVEQMDGRFLDEHGLADGNLYKMESGFGDPNNLGPEGPTDSSDLRAFLNAYNGGAPTSDWWRTNLNLDAYFNYQAIVQGIHHYDIADGKNYFYHRDPATGLWTVLPWDLDLTWSDNMYRAGQQGGNEPFKSRVLSNFAFPGSLPDISRAFRNRVRELRDLLWNTDEGFRLIDEYARLLRGTNTFSLIDADRAQWDYNPVMTNPSLVNLSKAGWGRFYESGVGSRDFAGMVRKMKDYIVYRASNPVFSLDTMSAEPALPATPTASASGPDGFPINRLRFTASPYSGSAPLESVRWRIAEVTRPDHPAWDPGRPEPREVHPLFDTGELTAEAAEFIPPANRLRVGHLYRVRVRHTDALGRASHWSAPVEFTAGESDNAAALEQHLTVTELMYNPPPDGFEFIELHNTSDTLPLDLGGLDFTDGIDFEFPAGVALEPGGYLLVVGTDNLDGFREHYGLGPEVPVLGPYSGRFANSGEFVTLKTAAGGTELIDFHYLPDGAWPVVADGGGHSLVRAEGAASDLSDPAAWRASTFPKGSPGRADPPAPDPDRPEFTGVRPVAQGLEVGVTAPAGVRHVLEVSSDLREWTPWRTNTGSATLILPMDADTRLIRSRVLP